MNFGNFVNARSFLFALVLLPLACTQGPSLSQSQTTAASKPACELTPGSYPVQTAEHNSQSGAYALFLLNAPSCLKQPFEVTDLKLSRLEDESKESAVYENSNGEQVLKIKQDYKIALVQPIVENGQVVRQESSMWSPFLAGAAGAVAGSMLTGALMRPKYYTPPPPGTKPNANGVVSGYGGSGSTQQAAYKSYQRKFNSTPPVAMNQNNKAPAKRGFFKQKNSAPEKKNSGFFKKKNTSRSKGFFKRRR